MVGKKIMVLNAGGTSLRVEVYDWAAKNQLAAGEVDWSQKETEADVSNHREGFDFLYQKLRLKEDELGAIGHRVVHGGAELQLKLFGI